MSGLNDLNSLRTHTARINLTKLTCEHEKKDAIKRAMRNISKNCGERSILSIDEKEEQIVQPLESGIISLDKAIGIGGYPRGRIIEIFGTESSGKTTVALHAVAETQKNKGFVAYVDVENALDPNYAKNIGVDLENLFLSQPNSAEQAFEVLEEFLMSGAFDLIVVDSVASLTPQKEIDGINLSGEQAKLMSEQLRKLVSIINKSKCVVIFINQIRSTMNKILGEKDTTPGGKALKFYSSVRIEITANDMIKNPSGEIIGKKTKLNIQKNKVSAPFKEAVVANIFGEGLTPYLDIIKIGIQQGLIRKQGEWYSFENQKIGKGIFEVKKYLQTHAIVFESLMERVKSFEKK